MSEPRTWVVIPAFRGRRALRRCLSSIAGQVGPHSRCRSVVVDNASVDRLDVLVEQEFPSALLLRSSENRGFAAGCNLALRRAAATAGVEYTILLNQDAWLDRHCVHQLVQTADRRPDAALIGARILTPDGTLVEFDGTQFDVGTTSGGYADRPYQPDPTVRAAAYACGGAALLRVAHLREVGFLEDTFFAYHEDIDLALRCWLHGYHVLNAGGALAFHEKGKAGAGDRFRHLLGSRNLLLTLFRVADREWWADHGCAVLDLYLRGDDPVRPLAALSALLVAPQLLRQRRDPAESASYSHLVRQWRVGS
jgi:GT2 family glycosyltransferase